MDEAAFTDFIRTIPDVWTKFERDNLTAMESKALAGLVEWGIVELRARVRFRCIGEQVTFLATITRTGKGGGKLEAGKILKLAFGNEWKASACKVERGEKPAWMENAGPEFWRLTASGVFARNHPEEIDGEELEPVPGSGHIDDIQVRTS